MVHPVHQANETSPFGDLSKDQFYQNHNVLHHESFILNKNNINIFTQSWQPLPPLRPLRGLVAMIHGYSSESSWVFQTTAVAIAELGFYVCALDLPGHGFSGGPRGRVPDIRPVVDDCIQFFDSARSVREKLPAFLYGESLGGAIAVLVYLKQKGEWNGMVLNGAMCGVSKRFKPPWPVENLLPVASFLAPNWKLSITKPLAKSSYKEEWKRRLVMNSPNKPRGGKPAAATALEFLRVVKVVRKRCKEVDVPMLVLHGEDDVVCDVESARKVFEMAGSVDKTMKVFPGMGHQLIGEPAEEVDLAFGVVFSWLEVQADKAAAGDGLELEVVVVV